MNMIRIADGTYDWQGFRLKMDFVLSRGSFTAVLGPSGSGKSTLLNILAGFENLTSGKISLDGKDHTSTHPSARPVSFVFQDNNTFAHLSVFENVALGIAPNMRLTSSQREEVSSALNHVGIAHLRDRKPGDMSGGERQRIALARVLVRQKPILLLDEAFAALGPALRNDMLDLVKTMQRQSNLTVLMVTHQPEDAKRVADDVIFIADGKIQEPMPVNSFFNSKDDAIRRYLIGDS